MEANTVAVPIIKKGHVVGLCPVWMSPDEYAAAALPGAAQAPISGADVSGKSLKEMIIRTDTGARDAINVIARMTCLKVTVALILGQLGIEHPEATIAETACLNTLKHWHACSSGELAAGAGRPETRSQSARAPSINAHCDAPAGTAAINQFLGMHHATLGGWVGGHFDFMGDGLEDKVALAGVGGLEHYEVHLERSGAFQRLPQSACAFQAYKVATLISSPGPSCLGDCEMSVATHKSAYHALPADCNAMPGAMWYRGAFVRGGDGFLNVIYYRGGSLCDHPAVGSVDWVQAVQDRYQLTMPQALAVATFQRGNQTGLAAWRNATAAERAAHLAAHAQGAPVGHQAGAAANSGQLLLTFVAAQTAASAGAAAQAAAAAGAAGAGGDDAAGADDAMRNALLNLSNFELQRLINIEVNARVLIAQDLSGADTQGSVLRQGELARELLNNRAQVDNSIDDEEEG